MTNDIRSYIELVEGPEEITEAPGIEGSGPRVYVGTYGKYSSGSINGKWMDLDDYPDAESFYAAAKQLHSDEADPELMFQDFEGFPPAYYDESYIAPELWDWLELDEQERELLAAYQEGVEDTGTIEDARDAFMGSADTKHDFAYNWYDEMGTLANVPEELASHINWDSVAREMEMGNIVFVRRNNEVWAFNRP